MRLWQRAGYVAFVSREDASHTLPIERSRLFLTLLRRDVYERAELRGVLYMLRASGLTGFAKCPWQRGFMDLHEGSSPPHDILDLDTMTWIQP